MLEILFLCTCGEVGVITADRRTWLTKTLEHTCPRCETWLHHKEHFEVLNRALQRERVNIVYKMGPMTDDDRQRLEEIHEALGNTPVGQVEKGQEDLVIRRVSAMMNLVRQEMKKEINLNLCRGALAEECDPAPA